MRSVTYRIATLGVLVLALAFTGSATAVPTPYANGNVFNETFDGGAFSETGSLFMGDPVAVSFDSNAVKFFNNSQTGEYEGDFTAIGTTSEYVIEVIINVGSALIVTENAMVMNPSDVIRFPCDLKLEAKEAAGGTWDIEIADAVSSSTMAGLTLTKDAYHYVAQHHRGNAAGDVDLYVDGNLAGTYTDRDKTRDVRYVQLGNVSGEAYVGFGIAHFDSVVFGTVPPAEPPVSLGRSDGSIFYETFKGGAFSETGSVFDGDGVGTTVSFDSDAAMFVNHLDGKGGEYQANVGQVSTDSEYVVEVLINISSARDITENAFVANAFSYPVKAFEVDLKLEAKQIEPNSVVMWDLEVQDASGASMVGLFLTTDEYHYVSQHHLGNPAGDIDLYVDGNLVGTYTDREKTEDLGHLHLGNVSGVADVGFGFAWVSSVSVGDYGTPPRPQCGDPGTVYLQSDLSKDCQVDLTDVAIFAREWLYCTDPADPNCDQYLHLAQ